jgi:hypothetical protein
VISRADPHTTQADRDVCLLATGVRPGALRPTALVPPPPPPRPRRTAAPGRSKQALTDLNDGSRLTYVGPAGEAREVLRATIQLFAPDEEIRKQSWFEGIKQGNQTNPSQAERLRYVVQVRGGDHRHAAEAADMIDARIGRLGRNVYQRASAALHADNQRQEVRKLVGWVFAVLDEVLPE